MNRQSVYTNGHGFGWNQVKLLSVRAVFVKLVNHFLSDALWPCSGQLVDFFRVRIVAVKCPELAASVTEQNDVMVGIALLKLLEMKKTHVQEGNKPDRPLHCWQLIHWLARKYTQMVLHCSAATCFKSALGFRQAGHSKDFFIQMLLTVHQMHCFPRAVVYWELICSFSFRQLKK